MSSAGHPSAQLESGLGLRPHEFESRILRKLTGETLSGSHRRGSFRVQSQFQSQLAALGGLPRTLANAGRGGRTAVEHAHLARCLAQVRMWAELDEVPAKGRSGARRAPMCLTVDLPTVVGVQIHTQGQRRCRDGGGCGCTGSPVRPAGCWQFSAKGRLRPWAEPISGAGAIHRSWPDGHRVVVDRLCYIHSLGVVWGCRGRRVTT